MRDSKACCRTESVGVVAVVDVVVVERVVEGGTRDERGVESETCKKGGGGGDANSNEVVQGGGGGRAVPSTSMSCLWIRDDVDDNGGNGREWWRTLVVIASK